GRDDLRAAVVAAAVDAADLDELLANDGVDPRRIAEDAAQLLDPLAEVAVLLFDPAPLEAGQRAEPQIENRLRLDLGQLKATHQRIASAVGVIRGPDQRDHLVEVVERDQVALEDVRTPLGLAQLVLQAPGDHVTLEVEVVAE